MRYTVYALKPIPDSALQEIQYIIRHTDCWGRNLRQTFSRFRRMSGTVIYFDTDHTNIFVDYYVYNLNV